jgi:predicted nuclease of restriction endonuclease-like (RecB) superfamily
MADKPHFVFRDGMTADRDYVQWIADIKSRYRNSQIKAAIKVNSALLEFYWSVGRDLAVLKAEERWGSGIVKQFALDMRNAFPDAKGFSYSNVKDMKRWYLFYYKQVIKGQQVVDPNDMTEKGHQSGGLIAATEKSHQVGGLLEMPEIFGQVPWKHHVYIVSKSKSLDEALFYIDKVVVEGWSRSWLEDQIAHNLYRNQGSAITNLDNTLPSPQSQLAKELLKNEYNLSFITSENIKREKDLEEALVTNVTRFLLELGKGFAYVGRQMELRMDDETTFFPDLVFYHIPQKRYVIIELKAVKFEPEYAGKLNFYVTAADKLLKGDDDNESVGLIICKTAKRTIVEWSLQDIAKPLGVATYQLEEVVARTVAELEQRQETIK